MVDALPPAAYVTAMAELEGVGPARLRHLVGLGEPSRTWHEIVRGTIAPVGSSIKITVELIRQWQHQATHKSPEESIARIRRAGIGVVTQTCSNFPPVFANDPEPPAILFYRGDLDALGSRRVGIIGTRRATAYGQRVAKQLSYDLSEAQVAIVSGLALGIDAAAHLGVFGSTHALPIAVVGAGLDRPCPRRNLELAEHIATHGLLLSEVPLGIPAAPWRFPVRNRIIAALSEVVIVVESSATGGSMHTVREALDRDRTIFAVPGPVGSVSSAGTNQLLSEGAQVCTSSQDILAALDQVGFADTSAFHPPHKKRPSKNSSNPQSNGSSSGSSSGESNEQSDIEPLTRTMNATESDGGCPTVNNPANGSQQAKPQHVEIPHPNGIAGEVLNQLSWELTSFDQLALQANVDLIELSKALRVLESAGWISRRDGWVQRLR